LVGRRSELGQFRAVLEACVKGTTGTALLIRGEAGIGKTRLMDQLQSIAAASGMSCTAGFVLDFGTARCHGAVRTVVAGLLGLGSEVTPDGAESAIDEILRDGRLQADDALYLRDLLEMSPPQASRKHYEAIYAAARTRGKERVKAARPKRPSASSSTGVSRPGISSGNSAWQTMFR
jgi:AAA ATPase domain